MVTSSSKATGPYRWSLRRFVGHTQVRRFHSHPSSNSRLHERVQHPGHEQSALDWVLRFAGQEHLLYVKRLVAEQLMGNRSMSNLVLTT